MKSETKLAAALQQLNFSSHSGGLRLYYGKVKSVDEDKDTCIVSMQSEGLEAEVNLRVGQGMLTSSFVTYPKVGALVLFLSKDSSFDQAYMINCSEVDKVVLKAGKSFEVTCNDESMSLQAEGEATTLNSKNLSLSGTSLSLNGASTMQILSDEPIEITVNKKSFGKLLLDLITAIKSLTVATPMGPSGTPLPPSLNKLIKLEMNLKKVMKTS